MAVLLSGIGSRPATRSSGAAEQTSTLWTKWAGGAGAELVQEGDRRSVDGVLASHRIKSSCFPARSREVDQDLVLGDTGWIGSEEGAMAIGSRRCRSEGRHGEAYEDMMKTWVSRQYESTRTSTDTRT
jgi:hypothetical protein